MSAIRRPIRAGVVVAALVAILVSSCGHRPVRVNSPLAPARLGTTRVRLEVIPSPRRAPGQPVMTTDAATPPAQAPAQAEQYVVQAGAFAERARAESLRSTLEPVFGDVRVLSVESRPVLWRVIVGRGMSRQQAAEIAVRVRRETGAGIVVPDPDPASRETQYP